MSCRISKFSCACLREQWDAFSEQNLILAVYLGEKIAYFDFFVRLQIVPPSLEFTLPGHTSELYLLLKADYTVEVLDSDKGNPIVPKEDGTWTVVYDQSIVVNLPKRGAVYTANFRYSMKP